MRNSVFELSAFTGEPLDHFSIRCDLLIKFGELFLDTHFGILERVEAFL